MGEYLHRRNGETTPLNLHDEARGIIERSEKDIYLDSKGFLHRGESQTPKKYIPYPMPIPGNRHHLE